MVSFNNSTKDGNVKLMANNELFVYIYFVMNYINKTHNQVDFVYREIGD